MEPTPFSHQQVAGGVGGAHGQWLADHQLARHTEILDFPVVMLKVGLTGGIGMGKSAATEILLSRGVKVVDSDVIARALVEPGQPALREISDAFGGDVIDAEGGLDRRRMASIVFHDSRARKTLESILHPRIRELWQGQLRAWEIMGETLGVFVIPLLYETGAESQLDRVVCMACPEGMQLERLRKRGWNDDEIQQRLAAQIPAKEKIDRADHVVWTDGNMEAHEAQWDHLLSLFSSAAGDRS